MGNIRGQRVASVDLYPISFNPYTSELNFYQRIGLRLSFEDKGKKQSLAYRLKSIPGDARLKIYTSKEGLYRIGWNEISNRLSSLNRIDPRTIKVYFKGEEIPILVKGEEDGRFDHDDYIEFYAISNDSKYSKENVYWLTYGGDYGKRMENILSIDDLPVDIPDRFRCTKHIEENEFYWGERIGDENLDRWFFYSYIWGGDKVDYEIYLEHLNSSHIEDEARVKISYYALFDVKHHTLTYINGNLIDEVMWDGQDEHIVDVIIPQGYLNQGENTITIEARLQDSDYDLIIPNYFEIGYHKNLVADQDICDFSYVSDGGITQFDVSGFTDKDIKLFDITDTNSLINIEGFEVIEDLDGLYSISLKDLFMPGEVRRYLALTSDRLNSPDKFKLDIPSNLSSKKNKADYLIITHKDFKEALIPLKALYENRRISNGRYMRVKLIDVEDIYDEFNFGIKSPYAIKDFLSYTYNNWRYPHPTYVLLIGDSSYDYRDYLGYGDIDYLPTYLIPNTPYLGETASDNWFVCLDGEDDILPDMFIGRIPARRIDEVEDVIGKIIDYSTKPIRDWNRNILLLADDEEQFEDASDSLISYVPKVMRVSKIYLGTYQDYSLFTEDIIEGIEDGTLILNYMGHGSTDLWTEEALFDTYGIDLLNNKDRYPFVTSFTCLDGYYLNPEQEYSSMAEVFLKSGDKGAIACWSPTGMGMPEGHEILSQELFKTIFQKGMLRLGVATTQAKLELFSKTGTSYKDLIHTYTLFGDPALSLNMGRRYKRVLTAFESIYKSTLLNYRQSRHWRDKDKEAIEISED